MGAYRDAVNADGVYVHFELNNNFSDSEGLVPTDGSSYGGSTHSTFATPSFVKGGAGYHCDMGVGVDSGRFLSKVDADLASNLDNNDELSIELWYKPESIRTTGGQVNNLIRHDTNLWWLRSVNGYLQMLISTDLAGGIGHTDTTTQMSNGNVYHLVGTYDGADNKIRLYVNGSLVSTSPALTGNYLYFPTNTAWTYLGSPGTETMDALVDEVALYRKVLSLAEIQDHYNIGIGAATVSATVTDIDVTGKAATVTATTDAIISATVTDIDIAGQPATVTATAPNATVNAVVTDVDIAGQPATVTAEIFVDVNAVVTDVDIAGVAATVNVEVTTTQNAVVTDIDVAGNAPTVVISVDATVSDIDVLGYGPAVSAGGNVEIVFDVTDVDVTGKAATVTAVKNVTANVTSTNITLDAKDVDSLWDTLVQASNPIHWYKFAQDVDLTNIVDDGSSTLNGDFIPRWNNSDLVWPATQESITTSDYVNSIPGDTGGEGIRLQSTATTTVSENSPWPLIGGADYIYFGLNNVAFISPANCTYEFWFKTTSSYATMLNVSMSLSSQGGERTRAVGIHNGYLSVINIGGSLASDVTLVSTATVKKVDDGSWHHVVLTKSTSGSLVTYKSYLDGVATSNVISIGDLLYYTGSGTSREDSLGAAKYKSGAYYPYPDSVFCGYTATVYLDELAIYDTTLTASQIGNRYSVGGGSESVEITTTVTDVDVAGNATGNSKIINATKSNITVDDRSVLVSDGANVVISSGRNNIQVASNLPSLTSDSDILLAATTAEISLDSNLNKVSTDVKNFKFISVSDTTLSAFDAEEIVGLNFGGLLFNQEKILQFRIGNTSADRSTFLIYSDSRESDILDAVSLSTDKITWTNSITLENISSNSITDIIYVKLNTNFIYLLGRGSFLVKVEQTDA